MEVNPYEATEEEVAATQATSTMRIDGRRLVITSGAVLPPFCVKSNEPLRPEDMKRRRLSWCSPVVALLILLNILLLVLVYFVVRKRCEITYGISPAVLGRYRLWLTIKLAATISLLVALIYALSVEMSPGLVGTLFLLLVVAILAMFVGNARLTVVKHRKGEFWIAGCSRDFLARIEP